MKNLQVLAGHMLRSLHAEQRQAQGTSIFLDCGLLCRLQMPGSSCRLLSTLLATPFLGHVSPNFREWWVWETFDPQTSLKHSSNRSLPNVNAQRVATRHMLRSLHAEQRQAQGTSIFLDCGLLCRLQMPGSSCRLLSTRIRPPNCHIAGACRKKLKRATLTKVSQSCTIGVVVIIRCSDQNLIER